MRILLLAHPYLDLYVEIVDELIKQGHIVTVLRESKIPGDPYYKRQNRYKRAFLIWKWEKFKKAEKYWEQKFLMPELNQIYDLLFVIQGCTFHPVLLNHLKLYNPNIRTSLYIWDSNRMYDFFRNAKYFEKVYSFDLKDVESDKSGKINFLPFFWSSKLLEYQNMPILYKISSIGTNHDGRYFIYKKIINDLKHEKISYYIKLILSPAKKTIKDRILYLKHLLTNSKKGIEIYKLKHGIINTDFIEDKLYTPDSLCQIMAQSNAVLDTDNELQCGTTPRLIWALALNKHIYTTNKNITKFPFYNKKYIHIINRDSPQINWTFLMDKEVNTQNDVLYLRIDNWIKNFV